MIRDFSPPAPLPATLSIALKEWAVTIRALREGRQVFILRKGGIHEAEEEFTVESRFVLLFPTYLHEDEQQDALQPCYRVWRAEETRRRLAGEQVRIETAAEITDIVPVALPENLFRFSSQHIFSDDFLKSRIEMSPDRPLYCLFLRIYELRQPVTIPMEPDYYGCRSWITLEKNIATQEAALVLSNRTYAERVRVLRRILERADSGPT